MCSELFLSYEIICFRPTSKFFLNVRFFFFVSPVIACLIRDKQLNFKQLCVKGSFWNQIFGIALNIMITYATWNKGNTLYYKPAIAIKKILQVLKTLLSSETFLIRNQALTCFFSVYYATWLWLTCTLQL